MTELFEHLMDGREVVIPFVLAGHYPRESPQASMVVTEALVSSDEIMPPHPYNGRPQFPARLANDQVVVVATDRLAHSGSCATCAPTWKRLRAALDGLPEDASITAALEMDSPVGQAGLLVDVSDLPDDYFHDEEGTNHGD